MINKVRVQGINYYEMQIGNSVGNLFTDINDVPKEKAKLELRINQQAK